MTYREGLLAAMDGISCTGKDTVDYELQLAQITAYLTALRERNGTVYFIGNGGSAAIAIHMTGDFLCNGKVRTHSMHDPATLTCLANDFGYEFVFAKQLERVAVSGDMLVAISSSGKSPNILHGVKVAREKGCQVLTLSGFLPDNLLRRLGDWNFYVPSKEYGNVETLHNMILQEIVDRLMLV